MERLDGLVCALAASFAAVLHPGNSESLPSFTALPARDPNTRARRKTDMADMAESVSVAGLTGKGAGQQRGAFFPAMGFWSQHGEAMGGG